MILLDLIYNLSVLVALSVLSAFLDDRFARERLSGKVLQGLLFGAIAVIGMLYPVVVVPGLIFDGRTVVISRCGLFYGPLAGGIAALAAGIYRITLGGSGLLMGLATSLLAWLVGWMFFRRRKLEHRRPFTKRNLYLMGILVHAGMIACMFLLPSGLRESTLRRVGPTIIVVYPLVTVLIGKILLDVMEHKLAADRIARDLEEKKVLLREVHHRVKNNMQVIISLFRLRRAKLVDARSRNEFREMENRIQTMARAQELLYQSEDFSGLDLRLYLHDVTGYLMKSAGELAAKISLSEEVDEISVDVDSAVIIGQIVTELISNSLKHAFPGGRTGRIGLSVKKGTGGLVLEYEDDGTGLPSGADVEEIADTGLKIVFGHVRRHKSGSIACTSGPGLGFRIFFPIEKPESAA